MSTYPMRPLCARCGHMDFAHDDPTYACTRPKCSCERYVEMHPGLTGPQTMMLCEVREKGVKRYNGRARSRVQALEKAGLVDVDWDLQISADGSSRWVITVTPKTAN